MMNYPQAKALNKQYVTRFFGLLVCLVAVAISASAQKSIFVPEAIGVTIEQCANGPASAPIHCNVNTANDGYTRGNLIASKSHYFEGDSVPIRIVADGLTIGTAYTVTIGYDYTKGGKYATDYLTSYNRTESVQNDPCVGVASCGTLTTFPIPSDPQVALGFDGVASADDITQIPGVFSCFGCTITSTSGYTLSGSTTGDSSKSITLSFTANSTSIVIAYGSHISTRVDWGLANSAINISGSPYHNYIVDFPGANSGNRDLQLSAEAVVFPASISITKLVANSPAFSSTQQFLFTSNNTNVGTFSLTDTDPSQFGGGSITRSGLTTFGTNITITEGQINGWTLSDLVCSINSGGGSTVGTAVANQGTRTVTINLQEGNNAACTFSNTQAFVTAAPVSVSGRVVDWSGRGISGARINVVNPSNGSINSVLTNGFGYYTVDNLPAGEFYVVTVAHKRYTFTDDTRALSVNDDVANMDFTANP